MTQNTNTFTFNATVEQEITTRGTTVLCFGIPKDISALLPSRGMVSVRGSCNEKPFHLVLEPDGKGSHLCILPATLTNGLALSEGSLAAIAMSVEKVWPTPKVPQELQQQLEHTAEAQAAWLRCTVPAYWDWIRWIQAAKQEETRRHRLETCISMLLAGKRRPCCFDRNQKTLTEAQ